MATRRNPDTPGFMMEMLERIAIHTGYELSITLYDRHWSVALRREDDSTPCCGQRTYRNEILVDRVQTLRKALSRAIEQCGPLLEWYAEVGYPLPES